MNLQQFQTSVDDDSPPGTLSLPLQALWWDAKGDWQQAHSLIDDLSTKQGMAVHAYLHRKEGADSNAEYWYRHAGTKHRRTSLEEEWSSLAETLLAES